MLYKPAAEKETNKECNYSGGMEDWRPPHAGQIKETQQLIQKAQRLLLSAEHHIRESQRMIHEEGDPL